jgi:hypothetical protein
MPPSDVPARGDNGRFPCGNAIKLMNHNEYRQLRQAVNDLALRVWFHVISSCKENEGENDTNHSVSCFAVFSAKPLIAERANNIRSLAQKKESLTVHS